MLGNICEFNFFIFRTAVQFIWRKKAAVILWSSLLWLRFRWRRNKWRLVWVKEEYLTLTQFDGSVQVRRNSIVNALELRLSCTNLSIWYLSFRKETEAASHSQQWWPIVRPWCWWWRPAMGGPTSPAVSGHWERRQAVQVAPEWCCAGLPSLYDYAVSGLSEVGTREVIVYSPTVVLAIL